ncbi:MAG: class I SAM-dependent methyltransferase [Gemmatimonadales bacterium]
MPSIADAIKSVNSRFPIAGYMTPVKHGGAYATIAETSLQYLQPGDAILDFGCGPCDKTAILQAIGFSCAGCDDLQEDWHHTPGQRDSILAFARESGIDFRLNSGSGLPFEHARFDMVMMHDVLEHIHDSPRELLNDLLELAKPEGLLFITVPNQVNIKKRIEVLLGRTNLTAYETFYWSDIPWRGHIREYVRDDLVKMADYLGLEILELRGVDHMLQKIPPAARPPYLLATALFNGWKDSWLMVARKKKGWMARRSLSHEEKKEILPALPW